LCNKAGKRAKAAPSVFAQLKKITPHFHKFSAFNHACRIDSSELTALDPSGRRVVMSKQ
jgi:hypothetical protein